MYFHNFIKLDVNLQKTVSYAKTDNVANYFCLGVMQLRVVMKIVEIITLKITVLSSQKALSINNFV